jgi:hypothetical protein
MLELQLVSARETNAPEGVEPLNWQLITNLAVPDYEAARTCLAWYSRRGLIEMFHYTLKSGCAIEKLQADTAECLKKQAAIYSAIAIKIMHATYLARTEPEASCEAFLTQLEWKVLYCAAKNVKTPPKKPPTAYEAVIMIAKLGGFSGYKSSGFPGVKVIWWGMTKLNIMTSVVPLLQGVLG